METSPEIKQIAAALTTFQKDAPNIKKDGKGNYRKYATLDTLIETIREPLAANHLSYVQLPENDGLTTIIMHNSGEWIKATAKLTMDKQTPQGQGSAITYMRRYALSAALGLATEEDDDGEHASSPAKASVTPKKAPPSNATKEDVDKGTIKKLLAALGEKPETLTAARAVVAKLTGIEYVEQNYSKIIERLEALVETK